MTARAYSNPPLELPHLLLTAFARFAQWQVPGARQIDASVRGGTRIISTDMMAAMHDVA